MRKKNLILLTSITGLLLTLTPSQALAQESTAPTTSQSSDNNTSDSKDTRLPTDEKCHWKGETPVPENKYLKFLYDNSYKNYQEDIERIKNNEHDYHLKNAVDEGKMSDNEAQYRTALIHDRSVKNHFSSFLYFNILNPLDPESIKNDVNYVYDDPENADEIVQEIIDSYSLKDYLEYVDKYANPDIHTSYSSKELHDQYQKEFDELEKTIDYDDNDTRVWYFPDRFKVVKKLDKYSSDEEQIQRFIQLRSWLKYFPTREEVNFDDYKENGWGSASSGMINEIPDLLKIIKEKGLDNDEFYDKAKEYLLEHHDNWYEELPNFLKEEYNIDWKSVRGAKGYPKLMERYIYPVLSNPDFEIPRDVICDDEENPGEDTDTPTDTNNPGDKETTTPTTTPTTKTTSKQNKSNNKTSTKSSDKSTINTTPNNEDRKYTSTLTTSTTPTTPNQLKSPDKINTPNNPLTPNQEFTPVKNTKPGTFNGGVSSSVEGEEISEGGKVDTGSPTTSLLNKIRTIF